MSHWENIAQDIAAATGVTARMQQQGAIGGGCINEASRIRYGDTDYFVKLNNARQAEMFAAEAAGLAALRQCSDLRIPEPVCFGNDAQSAWLVLEYLPLGGHGNARALGAGLAAMHRITQDRYGWERDNTIGSTPQLNPLTDDWIGFWREQRLRFQLELAAHHGHGGRLQAQGELLLDCFQELFDGYTPAASLLHGDLWSGNHAWTQAGEPAIFDPAVYYGDRETDIAMTELFGGFGVGFYAAYEEAWPLDPGYRARKPLYNLYHVLNHLNLFGGGYLGQAQGMIDSLLAELR
ncbi:MAG TPA: fructosamine kinase family protein [Gammaproteobacteria bacterium]|nr:fructosamine kinase family protein [Gammaproteobacteria bacterium]